MRLRHAPLLAPVAITLWLFCTAISLRADVVILNDGTRIEGEIQRTEDGYDVVTRGGKVVKVTTAQVKSVEVKTPPTADEARRRLESLRRSSENMTDPKAVIARYTEFLRQFGDSDVAGEASRDLAEWEDRLERHMTKAGGKWVTTEELGRLQEESQTFAVKARDLVARARLREAGPLLDRALSLDPKNLSALYLRGVTLFRQEQPGQARKAFDGVAQQLPDHGPTLNNLAVILWRQEQYPGALKYFLAALSAEPDGNEVRVLDNVAEALHSLPSQHRDLPVTKKLVSQFQRLEDAARKKMEVRGLYRWGATWVEGRELDKLQDLEAEVEEKIKKLEAEFDDARRRIDEIDREIEETKRSIRRIEATSYSRDSTGRLTRLAYPRIYYDLQRDLVVLKRERDDTEASIDKLRRDAKAARASLPVPRYTGIQHIIDVEGTPMMAAEAPAAAE